MLFGLWRYEIKEIDKEVNGRVYKGFVIGYGFDGFCMDLKKIKNKL